MEEAVAGEVVVVVEAAAVGINPISKVTGIKGAGLKGAGIGWRPPLSAAISCLENLSFVEVIAESVWSRSQLPEALESLAAKGIKIIPHGISLGLAGADYPDRKKLKLLKDLAGKVQAPLISEHVAFVRGGGLEVGHLLGVSRNRQTLEIVIENVLMAMDQLELPLALENIACPLEPPGSSMSEGEFLSELVDRTGCWLLLDLENVHARACFQKSDPIPFLKSMPLDRVAYVHVAGGYEHGGEYHDTHDQPVGETTRELLKIAAEENGVPAFCLERDGNWPSATELVTEMEALRKLAFGNRS